MDSLTSSIFHFVEISKPRASSASWPADSRAAARLADIVVTLLVKRRQGNAQARVHFELLVNHSHESRLSPPGRVRRLEHLNLPRVVRGIEDLGNADPGSDDAVAVALTAA